MTRMTSKELGTHIASTVSSVEGNLIIEVESGEDCEHTITLTLDRKTVSIKSTIIIPKLNKLNRDGMKKLVTNLANTAVDLMVKEIANMQDDEVKHHRPEWN